MKSQETIFFSPVEYARSAGLRIKRALGEASKISGDQKSFSGTVAIFRSASRHVEFRIFLAFINTTSKISTEGKKKLKS